MDIIKGSAQDESVKEKKPNKMEEKINKSHNVKKQSLGPNTKR